MQRGQAVIPGAAEHIAGPVWLLPGENQGRFPRCHGVLIKGERTVLIDTGMGVEAIKAWQKSGGRADLILNSHTHPDHTAGNFLFKETPIWGPVQAKDSAGILDSFSRRFFHLPEIIPGYKDFVRGEMDFQDRAPDAFFEPDKVLDVGGVEIRSISAPGHSVDHTLFYVPESKALFTADIDLTSFGPWYGHQESSISLFKKSIRKAMALKPKVLIPSHKNPVSNGINEALKAYLDIFDKRDQAILSLLKSKSTLAGLVEAAPIYRGFPRYAELLRYWEGQMILRHLEDLLERGLVKKEQERYFRV